ncbi:MAG: hypothetical protein IPK08_10075 [Bacteroidetes bacterium]|nr:hypothetical protein [Bacteroidota bacterium]
MRTFSIILLATFFSMYTIGQIPGPAYSIGCNITLRAAMCTGSTLVAQMANSGKLYAVGIEGSCNSLTWIEIDVVGDHLSSPTTLPYAAYGGYMTPQQHC